MSAIPELWAGDRQARAKLAKLIEAVSIEKAYHQTLPDHSLNVVRCFYVTAWLRRVPRSRMIDFVATEANSMSGF
jgi:hypothetical protein